MTGNRLQGRLQGRLKPTGYRTGLGQVEDWAKRQVKASGDRWQVTEQVDAHRLQGKLQGRLKPTGYMPRGASRSLCMFFDK